LGAFFALAYSDPSGYFFILPWHWLGAQGSEFDKLYTSRLNFSPSKSHFYIPLAFTTFVWLNIVSFTITLRSNPDGWKHPSHNCHVGFPSSWSNLLSQNYWQTLASFHHTPTCDFCSCYN
jgi:hypothetical protein